MICLFNRQRHVQQGFQQQVLVRAPYSGTICSSLLLFLCNSQKQFLPGTLPDIAESLTDHRASVTEKVAGSLPAQLIIIVINLPIQQHCSGWKQRFIRQVFQNADPSLVQWEKTATRNTIWTHLRKETLHKRKLLMTVVGYWKGRQDRYLVQSRLHWLAWHWIPAGQLLKLTYGS